MLLFLMRSCFSFLNHRNCCQFVENSTFRFLLSNPLPCIMSLKRLFNPTSARRLLACHKTNLRLSLVRNMAICPLTTLNEDEQMMREAAYKFSHDVVAPLVHKMDQESYMEQVVRDGLFAQGFMGAEVPAEYGGAEASFFCVNLIIEELARVDPSVSVFCDVQNTLVAPIFMRWGSEQQKKDYLPRIVKDTVGAFCLSEAGSGSDAFALKATAKKHGDDYILNGTKMWITNAEHASFFFVMANAAPESGYKGITCFLVDRGSHTKSN